MTPRQVDFAAVTAVFISFTSAVLGVPFLLAAAMGAAVGLLLLLLGGSL